MCFSIRYFPNRKESYINSTSDSIHRPVTFFGQTDSDFRRITALATNILSGVWGVRDI